MCGRSYMSCVVIALCRWQTYVAPGRHRGLDRYVPGSQRRCLGSHLEQRGYQGSYCSSRFFSVSIGLLGRALNTDMVIAVGTLHIIPQITKVMM